MAIGSSERLGEAGRQERAKSKAPPSKTEDGASGASRYRFNEVGRIPVKVRVLLKPIFGLFQVLVCHIS
jgi:hypothetical protein